jgi:hypothetical protein
MMVSRLLQLDSWQTNIANTLAVTEIGPSLHDRSASIEAVGALVGSLYRSPDLMAQRLFEKIAGEPHIFPPRPKCGAQSVCAILSAEAAPEVCQGGPPKKLVCLMSFKELGPRLLWSE